MNDDAARVSGAEPPPAPLICECGHSTAMHGPFDARPCLAGAGFGGRERSACDCTAFRAAEPPPAPSEPVCPDCGMTEQVAPSRKEPGRWMCHGCARTFDADKSEGPDATACVAAPNPVGEETGTEARQVGLHQSHPAQEKPGVGQTLRAVSAVPAQAAAAEARAISEGLNVGSRLAHTIMDGERMLAGRAALDALLARVAEAEREREQETRLAMNNTGAMHDALDRAERAEAEAERLLAFVKIVADQKIHAAGVSVRLGELARDLLRGGDTG